MKKMNCWEFMNCGREKDGVNSYEFGICPVARNSLSTGVNNGECAGRVCWKIAGTMCGGEVQGVFAKKLKGCNVCKFFKIFRGKKSKF